MLKLTDNRRANIMVPFKDLPVGTVFEHIGLKMICMKIETFKYNDQRLLGEECSKNAIRLDNRDNGCGEAWFIAPEGRVHPISAELVITENDI